MSSLDQIAAAIQKLAERYRVSADAVKALLIQRHPFRVRVPGEKGRAAGPPLGARKPRAKYRHARLQPCCSSSAPCSMDRATTDRGILTSAFTQLERQRPS